LKHYLSRSITHYRSLVPVICGLWLTLMGLSLSLYAQAPAGSDSTSSERKSLEEGFLPDSPATALPGLPQLPALETAPNLSAATEITVKQFKFEGNTIFTAEQLNQEIPSRYLQRPISAEQLQEVKNLVTQFYIKEGYINSGAVIPDQPVTDDGIITLKIIEGTLVKVEVSNNKKLRPSYIEGRVATKSGEALNLNALQDRLQLLQQNPLIKYLNAELGPGVQLGEAVLKIAVEEQSPYQVQFTLNNHRSPSVGANRGEIEFWDRNLTGLFGRPWGIGDTLYLRYGLTKGLKDYSVRYDLPLNSHDTTVYFNAEKSDSEVVEEPFKQIDVKSDASTYAVGLSHPLWKTPSHELILGVRADKRHSKTYLLGRPFSFSPGVQDGETKISAIRLTVDWLKRNSYQVLAARSSFNFGIDAGGATINEDGTPDSEFFTWLGQFQWVRRLDWEAIPVSYKKIRDSQIIFRTDFQWAREDLLPLEKFSVGGATTVRGYRENYLTRDNGLISSFEWRIPVADWKIPHVSKNPEDGKLQLALFTDYGRATNADGNFTPEPKQIYSAGLGLRYDPGELLHAEVYWGKALKDVEEQEDKDKIQDNGIHFEMYLKW